MGGLIGLINRSRKRNIKLLYLLSSLFDISKPRCLKRLERRSHAAAYDSLPAHTQREVDRRVALYNKLGAGSTLDASNPQQQLYALREIKMGVVIDGRRTGSVYCFDILRYLRCYKPNMVGCFAFGDVSWIPAQPSMVKSRPIDGDNSNSVLMPLNLIRHFNFIHDDTPYRSKIDMLMGVSFAQQQHRQDFLRLYFSHPLCRLGSALQFEDERKVWNVEYISIVEQLRYKFILCLEGNDVATNLKWVMSSNSIAVMPKPKFETWFMESTLIGGVHYIEIAEDYSNLEEQLQYYISHPAEAQRIVDAAHQYIEQFSDKKIEKIVAMRVVERYFSVTGQV